MVAPLRFHLAHEGIHTLVDQRLDCFIRHIGKLQTQHIACLRKNGGEVSEKEDGVKDACFVSIDCQFTRCRCCCCWVRSGFGGGAENQKGGEEEGRLAYRERHRAPC